MTTSAERVRRAGTGLLRGSGRGLNSSVASGRYRGPGRASVRGDGRGVSYRLAPSAAVVPGPHADDFERAVTRAIELGRKVAGLYR